MYILNNIISYPIGLLLIFICIAVVIIICGSRLTIYGDALSIRLNLDNGLIGIVFLSVITSLPELSVSLSSILNESQELGTNLALGNILGSNLFNLMILMLLTCFFAKTILNFSDLRHQSKLLIQNVALLFVIIFSSFINKNYPFTSYENNFLINLLIPIFYILFLIKNKSLDQNENSFLELSNKLSKLPSLKFYSYLIFYTTIIIISGICLSYLASLMSLPLNEGGFGLSASLIGTIFLALSTSLPELVICITCLRLNLVQMAFGNLLGSNLFNILIYFIISFFTINCTLFASSSNSHLLTLLGILIISFMTLIVFSQKNILAIRIWSITILVIGVMFLTQY